MICDIGENIEKNGVENKRRMDLAAPKGSFGRRLPSRDEAGQRLQRRSPRPRPRLGRGRAKYAKKEGFFNHGVHRVVHGGHREDGDWRAGRRISPPPLYPLLIEEGRPLSRVDSHRRLSIDNCELFLPQSFLRGYLSRRTNLLHLLSVLDFCALVIPRPRPRLGRGRADFLRPTALRADRLVEISCLDLRAYILSPPGCCWVCKSPQGYVYSEPWIPRTYRARSRFPSIRDGK